MFLKPKFREGSFTIIMEDGSVHDDNDIFIAACKTGTNISSIRKLVLLAQERLDGKLADTGTGGDGGVVYPCLPAELWFYICSMLLRRSKRL